MQFREPTAACVGRTRYVALLTPNLNVAHLVQNSGLSDVLLFVFDHVETDVKTAAYLSLRLSVPVLGESRPNQRCSRKFTIPILTVVGIVDRLKLSRRKGEGWGWRCLLRCDYGAQEQRRDQRTEYG